MKVSAVPSSARSNWSLPFLKRLPSGAVPVAATVTAILICLVEASVVRLNTRQSEDFGYACLCIALLAAAAPFWFYARAAKGSVRVRCTMMFAALLTVSAAYVASVEHTLGLRSEFTLPYQCALFTTGEALYILAVVLFFSGVSRHITVLDMLQGLLFGVLRFKVTYVPTGPVHFTENHLLIGQLVALFLFLISIVAGLGAASEPERKYLQLLSWFHGLRFVEYFLADQVSYIWLRHRASSLWDVAGTAFMFAFALYPLFAKRSESAVEAAGFQARRPSLTVRSLMPSFLALANLLLGFFVLRLSITLAASAVLLALMLYVARTVLLQGQIARESAELQVRNRQLEGLATSDPLTGIGNRRSLAAVYTQMQTAGARSSVALLLMDIDYFKQVNDLMGHPYGDKVLIALARTLENSAARIRGSHCARFGGDEFALLLPGVSQRDAHALAEEVRSGFAAQTLAAGARTVSLSLGVHCFDADQEMPLEILVSHPDIALYRAKALGRDRAEFQVSQPLDQPLVLEQQPLLVASV